MTGLVIEIIRTIDCSITVHIVMFVGGISVMVVVFSGIAVPVTAVGISPARVGIRRDRKVERDN